MRNLNQLWRTNFDFLVISTIDGVAAFLKRFLLSDKSVQADPHRNDSKVESTYFKILNQVKGELLYKKNRVKRHAEIISASLFFPFLRSENWMKFQFYKVSTALISFFLSAISNFISAQQDSTTVNLQDLGPLIEPEPVQFTFQTPGWYFLAGVLFLLAVVLVVKRIRKYLKNAYRREALKNLAAIEEKYNQQNDNVCLNDVLVLLKLVAIKAFGRQNVAQLYGEDWLLFLEEKGKDTPFRKYSSSILSAAYHPAEIQNDEVMKIIGLTQKWIKTHA